MTSSLTTAAFLAFSTLAVLAWTLPGEEPESVAKVARVAPGTFRSVTSLRTDTGQVRIDEEVTVDQDEHLLTAYVRLEEPGHAPTSIWLDRSTTTAVVARGAEITRFQPPADAPWVYAPPETSRGAIATALGAWITTHAATGAAIRIVHPDRSEVVPADQLLVTTENGAVALVGDDPVDVDARFVTTLHLRGLDATLTRTEEAADRWVFRRALPRDAWF